MRDEIVREAQEATGERHVLVVPAALMALTGDLHSALLMSQLLYWTDRTSLADGWVYKTREDWCRELFMTPHVLSRCRAQLRALNLIEESHHLVNNRRVLHMRIRTSHTIATLKALRASGASADTPGSHEAVAHADGPDMDVTPRAVEVGPTAAAHAGTIPFRLTPATFTASCQPAHHAAPSASYQTAAASAPSLTRQDRHIDRLYQRCLAAKARQAAADTAGAIASPTAMLRTTGQSNREQTTSTAQARPVQSTHTAPCPGARDRTAGNRSSEPQETPTAEHRSPDVGTAAVRRSEGLGTGLPGTETAPETTTETTAESEGLSGIPEGERGKERKGERGAAAQPASQGTRQPSPDAHDAPGGEPIGRPTGCSRVKPYDTSQTRNGGEEGPTPMPACVPAVATTNAPEMPTASLRATRARSPQRSPSPIARAACRRPTATVAPPERAATGGSSPSPRTTRHAGRGTATPAAR